VDCHPLMSGSHHVVGDAYVLDDVRYAEQLVRAGGAAEAEAAVLLGHVPPHLGGGDQAGGGAARTPR